MGCLRSAEDRQHYDMESGIRNPETESRKRKQKRKRNTERKVPSDQFEKIYISNDNKINNHQYSISIQLGEKVELIAKTPELWSRHGSVMC